MRPRVLFISCHLPWPPLSGGRRRELELIRRLASGFDIHLLAISKTPEQDRRHVQALEPFCRRVDVLDADGSLGGRPERDEPVQIVRHRSSIARRRVSQILAADPPDLVHVEGFYLMQHVPEHCGVPVLLAEQNVEYELERQRALATGDELSVRRLARTRAAERACWRRASQVAAVTAEDRAGMQRSEPGIQPCLVPDGADHVPLALPKAPGRGPRDGSSAIAFVANFAYAPNVDAAGYLCQEILPLIRAAVPGVRVWLVGNAPPPEVMALADEAVSVTGHVPDVLPYLDAAAVAVCPLRIGGGIKVKMIEALRRGKAIVSTSVGAQGLDGPAREAIRVANEPRPFAHEATALLLDDERRAVFERRALDAARTMPSWDDAARALTSAYVALLEPAGGPARRLETSVAAGEIG